MQHTSRRASGLAVQEYPLSSTAFARASAPALVEPMKGSVELSTRLWIV